MRAKWLYFVSILFMLLFTENGFFIASATAESGENEIIEPAGTEGTYNTF